jgi:amidase
VLLFEFKADLNAFLARHMPGAPVKSLADVIEFNARNAELAMPIFGQDLLVKAQAKGPLTQRKYRAALARCRKLARAGGIDASLAKHRAQAIVALTSPPAWIRDPVSGDLSRGGCTTFPAVAGYPHVTVPAGYVSGLPIGISFFGARWSDARLLGIAHAYERATRHRRAPELA